MFLQRGYGELGKIGVVILQRDLDWGEEPKGQGALIDDVYMAKYDVYSMPTESVKHGSMYDLSCRGVMI